MSFFRSTVLEFIFLSVSNNEEHAYTYGVRFRSFSRLPSNKTTYLSYVQNNSPRKSSNSYYDVTIDHRNDPRSMEVLVERSKPSFLLPKKRGQISL